MKISIPLLLLVPTVLFSDTLVMDPFAEELPEATSDREEAEAGEEEAADESITEAAEEEPATWNFVSPVQARVALLGDQVSGVGTLAIIRERPVIVTTLQALDRNSSLQLRTLDGDNINPGRIVASTTGSIAIIEIDDPEKQFGYVAMDIDNRTDLREKSPVSIATGDELATGELMRPQGNFFPLNRFTGEAPAGAPVVSPLQGRFLGIFIPERKVFSLEQRGRTTGAGNLHEAGILVFAPELRWEVIEWAFFRDQRIQLDDFAATSRAVSGFLAGQSEAYANHQPLVAAQRRFSQRRSQAGFDLARERDSFIFTIASQASSNVTSFERDIFQLYGYFQAEAEHLLNERRRLIDQVNALRTNPSAVDRFAR